jgi:hypothetical protein
VSRSADRIRGNPLIDLLSGVLSIDDPLHDDMEVWSPAESRDEQCLFGRQVRLTVAESTSNRRAETHMPTGPIHATNP